MLAPAHWLLLQDTENVSWNSDRPRVEDNTGIPSQNHNEESLKNPHHTKQGKACCYGQHAKKSSHGHLFPELQIAVDQNQTHWRNQPRTSIPCALIQHIYSTETFHFNLAHITATRTKSLETMVHHSKIFLYQEKHGTITMPCSETGTTHTHCNNTQQYRWHIDQH